MTCIHKINWANWQPIIWRFRIWPFLPEPYLFARGVPFCQSSTCLPESYLFARAVPVCQSRNFFPEPTCLPDLNLFARAVPVCRIWTFLPVLYLFAGSDHFCQSRTCLPDLNLFARAVPVCWIWTFLPEPYLFAGSVPLDGNVALWYLPSSIQHYDTYPPVSSTMIPTLQYPALWYPPSSIQHYDTYPPVSRTMIPTLQYPALWYLPSSIKHYDTHPPVSACLKGEPVSHGWLPDSPTHQEILSQDEHNLCRIGFSSSFLGNNTKKRNSFYDKDHLLDRLLFQLTEKIQKINPDIP